MNTTTFQNTDLIAKKHNFIYMLLYFPIYGKFLFELDEQNTIIARQYTYCTFTDRFLGCAFIKKYYCPKHNPIIMFDNFNLGPQSDNTIVFKILFPYIYKSDKLCITLIHNGYINTDEFSGKLLSPQEIMDSPITDKTIKDYINYAFGIQLVYHPKDIYSVSPMNKPEYPGSD